MTDEENFRTNGVVVIKDGKLIFEDYKRGFNASKLHRLWSVTKTVAGIITALPLMRENSLKTEVATYYPKVGQRSLFSETPKSRGPAPYWPLDLTGMRDMNPILFRVTWSKCFIQQRNPPTIWPPTQQAAIKSTNLEPDIITQAENRTFSWEWLRALWVRNIKNIQKINCLIFWALKNGYGNKMGQEIISPAPISI